MLLSAWTLHQYVKHHSPFSPSSPIIISWQLNSPLSSVEKQLICTMLLSSNKNILIWSNKQFRQTNKIEEAFWNPDFLGSWWGKASDASKCLSQVSLLFYFSFLPSCLWGNVFWLRGNSLTLSKLHWDWRWFSTLG